MPITTLRNQKANRRSAPAGKILDGSAIPLLHSLVRLYAVCNLRNCLWSGKPDGRNGISVKRRVLLTLLGLAAATLFPACGGGVTAPAGAPPPSLPPAGVVAGTVTDEGSAAVLSGVAVTVTDGSPGGAVLATAVTDLYGRYRLDVPAVRCYVNFSKSSYSTWGGYVEVGDGLATTLNAAISEIPVGGWNVFSQADFDRLLETNACPNCRLSGADLRSVNLSGADLSCANLTGADLGSSLLPGALLIGAYLSGSDLSGADLTGAYLTGAKLVDANLSRARLAGANLTYWADLSGADLSGADLRGANLSPGSQYLSGANLTGADLTGADLSGAIWTDNRVCLDNSIGECR